MNSMFDICRWRLSTPWCPIPTWCTRTACWCLP